MHTSGYHSLLRKTVAIRPTSYDTYRNFLGHNRNLTSQIWSRIKYLIPTDNIIFFFDTLI